jgi:hypothetical protein
MANLGMRSVTLLKDNDRAGLKAGDVVEASCWLNLDAYAPCAEVTVDGQVIGLGRMDYSGGWRFTDDNTQEQYAHFMPTE